MAWTAAAGAARPRLIVNLAAGFSVRRRARLENGRFHYQITPFLSGPSLSATSRPEASWWSL